MSYFNVDLFFFLNLANVNEWSGENKRHDMTWVPYFSFNFLGILLFFSFKLKFFNFLFSSSFLLNLIIINKQYLITVWKMNKNNVVAMEFFASFKELTSVLCLIEFAFLKKKTIILNYFWFVYYEKWKK